MDPNLQQQLLQQLRDIHEPAAIGWWPLAIGWWILIAIVVSILLALAVLSYVRYKQNAYRREALYLAKQYRLDYETDSNVVSYLEHVNQLLRRLMLKISRDEQLAQTSGHQWVSVLNQHCPVPLSEDTATALAEKIYQPNPSVAVTDLHEEVILWIKTHRRAPGA